MNLVATHWVLLVLVYINGVMALPERYETREQCLMAADKASLSRKAEGLRFACIEVLKP